MQDYADFVTAVAERYRGRVKYYQLWNEPNIYPEWGGAAINPEAYAELLKAAGAVAESVNQGDSRWVSMLSSQRTLIWHERFDFRPEK